MSAVLLATLGGPKTTWYLARASGLTAWCLVLTAVLLGLVMSARPKWKAMPPAWRLDLHRFLAVLALLFTGVHVAALMVDPSVPFRVVDVLVPFASRWRPGPVAWGVVGLYLLVLVEVSSLLMKRIPRRWWHGIHLSSFVLLVAATVHGLTAGTDAANPLVEDVLLVASVVTLQLAAFRVWRARTREVRPRAAGAAAGERPAAHSAGRPERSATHAAGRRGSAAAHATTTATAQEPRQVAARP